MNRRPVLGGAALIAAAALNIREAWRSRVPRRAHARSHVAVLRCDRYEQAPQVVQDGLKLLAPSIRNKRVLLKPNLVEYAPETPINTNPVLIASVINALYRMGAASVIVGEGPGHVRDTDLLLFESGLQGQLDSIGRAKFVDLNFDSVARVPLATGLTGLGELWLPQSVLGADVLISMPKVKTHHWAGVTLSLKNLFGIVPGSIYGWPKNLLHWEGIENSITELATAVPIHFVIADGVEAMEGDGPLHGPMKHLGCLVFADDPVAADGTCCRLMGIEPSRVRHVAIASPLGNLEIAQIEQRGETIASLKKQFDLIQSYGHLRG